MGLISRESGSEIWAGGCSFSFWGRLHARVAAEASVSEFRGAPWVSPRALRCLFASFFFLLVPSSSMQTEHPEQTSDSCGGGSALTSQTGITVANHLSVSALPGAGGRARSSPIRARFHS